MPSQYICASSIQTHKRGGGGENPKWPHQFCDFVFDILKRD